MPLPLGIPPRIQAVALQAYPWTVLALLFIPICLLLLSSVPTDGLRRGFAIVVVKIGAAELAILRPNSAAEGGGGRGEAADVFYVNMWGWCIEDRCSEPQLLTDLGFLEELPLDSALNSENFPPALTGMLLAHGLSAIASLGASVTLGLELWSWWRQDNAPEDAVRFHKRPFKWVSSGPSMAACLLTFITVIVDSILLARIRSGSPPGSTAPGAGLSLTITAFFLLLLHVISWTGPSAYQRTIAYWRARRVWFDAWKEGVHQMQPLPVADTDREKGRGDLEKFGEAQVGNGAVVSVSEIEKINRQRKNAEEARKEEEREREREREKSRRKEKRWKKAMKQNGKERKRREAEDRRQQRRDEKYRYGERERIRQSKRQRMSRWFGMDDYDSDRHRKRRYDRVDDYDEPRWRRGSRHDRSDRYSRDRGRDRGYGRYR